MIFHITALLFVAKFSAATETNEPDWTTERFTALALEELGKCNAANISQEVRKVFGLNDTDPYNFSDYALYFNHPDFAAMVGDTTVAAEINNSTTTRDYFDNLRKHAAKKYPAMIKVVDFIIAIHLKKAVSEWNVIHKISMEVVTELVQSENGEKGKFSDLPSEEINDLIHVVVNLINELYHLWIDIGEKTPKEYEQFAESLLAVPVKEIQLAYYTMQTTAYEWEIECKEKNSVKP